MIIPRHTRERQRGKLSSYATIFGGIHERARKVRFAALAALLLVAANLMAQQPKKKPDPKPQPAQSQVAPDDFVILITGACQTPPGEFAVRDCIRGVTREEFEALLAATNPKPTPKTRQKLAATLGQIIILSNEAKKRGLPKDPEIKQIMRVEQMQLLANLLVQREMKSEASKVTDTDLESFYNAHVEEFRTVDLVRIQVPSKAIIGGPSEDDKAFAETIRARCAVGEDPNKLQAEAMHRTGQAVIPAADLKDQRRSMLPADQQSIVNLKPGECSPVIADRDGLAIYKVVAARIPPMPEVRSAVAEAIEAERMRTQLETLKKQNAISLNGRYFEATPSPMAGQPAKSSGTAPPKH
jgi:hypothetical protein